MKKIKNKILEISDKIHEDDMEYSMYSRDEFIKEIDENITSLSAAKAYLKAMSDECDRLIDEMEVSSWLSIKEEIRQCMYTIWDYALKEKKEKFWKEKMEQISVGDIFYNYIGEQENVKFYRVVKKNKRTIKCQELMVKATKKTPRNTKPGKPVEGKLYMMKNENIRGEWCCPYTESEPVSLYSPKSFHKNH